MAEKKGRGGRKRVPASDIPPPAVTPGPVLPVAYTPEELGGETGVKAYEMQRDILVEIAAHLKLSQKDALLRYLRHMQEDLLYIMSHRTSELKKGGQPPTGD